MLAKGLKVADFLGVEECNEKQFTCFGWTLEHHSVVHFALAWLGDLSRGFVR